MSLVNTQEILAWGRRTLDLESETLAKASERLGEAFVAAVTSILGCNGKVVLTGLGKSGHVAKKIAATLSSTGTSSYFLHPTEALHGDFGTIGKNDVLLAIGFNGETREVNEVAKYARRLGVTVCSITGNLDSTLAKLSQHVLDGRVAQEACPLNLAPTCSTTLALALGDALAVALMKARGFQETDFAQFHPDGALGRKLSIVSDHMHAGDALFQLREQDTFNKVLERVKQDNFGISAVVNASGKLCGVITDGDLRRAIIKNQEKVFALNASQIMSRHPKTISESALAVDAFRTMEENRITVLIVHQAKDREILVGIVRMHDLLAAKIV